MSNTYWDQRNKHIFSHVGHWQAGFDVTIEGYSLMNELMGNVSWVQLIVLNATGRLPSKAVADWIEVSFMGLSYPDSRIWCNQVGAYAGDTNTSVVAAASSAILAADSRAYGGSQTRYLSMDFQHKALKRYQAGESMAEIVKGAKFTRGKPIITGFARPIDREDERLAPFEKARQDLGLELGEHLSFAQALSHYLDEHYGLSMNCGGYAAALLLDQGFTPTEGYRLSAFSVISGAIACYRNLDQQAPNSFLPLKCEDIDYLGPKPRAIAG